VTDERPETRRFAHQRLHVPSQEYTFALLRAAIRREAVVFVTRGQAVWEAAVPELRGYSRAFRTNRVQNVVTSPRNCREGWETARATPRQAASRMQTGEGWRLARTTSFATWLHRSPTPAFVVRSA
jgi:formate-dependent phosphoribosylglycinamide formyltransferase (GAR transformylase)